MRHVDITGKNILEARGAKPKSKKTSGELKDSQGGQYGTRLGCNKISQRCIPRGMRAGVGPRTCLQATAELLL